MLDLPYFYEKVSFFVLSGDCMQKIFEKVCGSNCTKVKICFVQRIQSFFEMYF